MTLRNKKLLLLATAMIVTLPFASAFAGQANLDSHVHFRAAIVLSQTQQMEYGNVEYSAAPAGGDTVDLGTDGNIAYNGNFSAGSAAGAHLAGTVTVTAGQVGDTVEIRCDATAHMTEAGGESIDVVAMEVDTSGPGVAFGAGSPCAGSGAAGAATTLVLAGGDVLRFGGQIDGATASGAFNGGDFSTTNGGGVPAVVDVIYQ
jgi:hypothetical protein